MVHYGGNPFLEKNLDNFIVIDSELLNQLLAWKLSLPTSSMSTRMGVVALTAFAHMALWLALFIFLPPLRIHGALRMSMFESAKTTSINFLLQVVTLLFTPSKGLLAFLHQFSLPFENRDQGKNISKSLPWRRKQSK